MESLYYSQGKDISVKLSECNSKWCPSGEMVLVGCLLGLLTLAM